MIKAVGAFVALAIMIIIVVILLICFRLCSATKYSCFSCYMKIKNKIFYNLFIRFALQGFLKFCIAACTTLSLIDWSKKEGV